VEYLGVVEPAGPGPPGRARAVAEGLEKTSQIIAQQVRTNVTSGDEQMTSHRGGGGSDQHVAVIDKTSSVLVIIHILEYIKHDYLHLIINETLID